MDKSRIEYDVVGMNAIFNHLTEIKHVINITSKVIKCGINKHSTEV